MSFTCPGLTPKESFLWTMPIPDWNIYDFCMQAVLYVTEKMGRKSEVPSTLLLVSHIMIAIHVAVVTQGMFSSYSYNASALQVEVHLSLAVFANLLWSSS